MAAVPALLVSALSTGIALAADDSDHDESTHSGFTPNSPMDGLSDHWQEYHKGKSQEEQVEDTQDPGYAEEHHEMVEHMLGE